MFLKSMEFIIHPVPETNEMKYNVKSDVVPISVLAIDHLSVKGPASYV